MAESKAQAGAVLKVGGILWEGARMTTQKANLPFVRNAWYIAAWAEELDQGLLARTIMSQPIVISRDAAGRLGALEDRCCHRGAPLTHGAVVEQGLQCGYHGLIYDISGACVLVPGQKNVPKAARVQSFPVVEKDRILWIWMGDPARADEGLIIDFPYHNQPETWPHCKDVVQVEANYVMLVDNLMDPSHLAYVHGGTIGGDPNAHAAAQLETKATEKGAHFIRWMLDCQPPPTFVKGGRFTGQVDRWHEFEYLAPAIVLKRSGAIAVGRGARNNRDQDGFHIRLLHCGTPRTETSFHYFWSAARGYRQDDPQATRELYDDTKRTIIKAKVIMEAQQARVALDPNRLPVGIEVDGALALARIALDN